jgi:hypothetical protein
MSDHVPSSPHFFRPVVRALLAALALLLLAAALVPAPLEPAADPARPPNPAKSAWFLLWVQELVSHGTLWMYAVLALAAGLVALPWLRRAEGRQAGWFQRGERIVAGVAVALVLAIVALTFVALYMRGENWRLHAPF